MDDDHERQQRDLQRASKLLDTMSREELGDMLRDILFNESSDDTRKLSDWMAFQIIIQDETRHARKLLAQLGKDGRNHHRVRISELPSVNDRRPAIPSQGVEGQDDELEGDSSSAASFVTCPDAEYSRCPSARETSKAVASQATDKSLGEIGLVRPSEISDSPSKEKDTLFRDKKDLKEGALARSTLGIENPHYRSNERPSLLQWCLGTALRRNPKASSDSGNSDRGLAQPRSLLNLGSASYQAAARRDGLATAACLRPSSKIRRVARTTKTLKTTNELGLKNLAELYARFDKTYVEELELDLLTIDAQKTHGQELVLPTTNQAFEDKKKMQCKFCKEYFNVDQNVRELDNGAYPCSHHPGEKDPGKY